MSSSKLIGRNFLLYTLCNVVSRLAMRIVDAVWTLHGGSIVRFATPGSLLASNCLQVSRSFASNETCKIIVQHGEIIMGGYARMHQLTGEISYFPGIRYDSYDDEWRSLLPSDRQRNKAMHIILDKFLYAIGGQDPFTDAVTNTVTRYSFVLESVWEERAPMIHRRTDSALVVSDKRIYVLGGYQDTHDAMVKHVLASVESYCPQDNVWYTAPSMIHPRMRPRGVAIISEEIYVIDGADYWDNDADEILWLPEPTFYPYVEALAPDRLAWRPLPQILGPRPLDYVAVTELNGMLYLIGGIHSALGGERSDVADVSLVQRYVPYKDSWEMIAPLSQARHLGVAASIQGYIFVFGGTQFGEFQEQRHVRTVECFDPETGRWKVLNPMPVPLEIGFSVSSFRNSSSIYLIGCDADILRRHGPPACLECICFEYPANSWRRLSTHRNRTYLCDPDENSTVAANGVAHGSSFLSMGTDPNFWFD